MKSHVGRRLFLAAAVLGVAAVFAVGLLVAVGVRSVVAGPAGDAGGPIPPAGHPWEQVEGHGDDGNTVYVYTEDSEALELRVNGARALRLEPNDTSPNVIGGYSGNSVTAPAVGATVGGGGNASHPNSVTADYGTVGGGQSNKADYLAAVGGGDGNTASGWYSTVGGGRGNNASDWQATVGGGVTNAATKNWATVGGGDDNTASGQAAIVGGGRGNNATDDYCAVGGGGNNQAGDNDGNTANATYATVGGGESNTASADWATVGGGRGNIASKWWATVGGGQSNTASEQGAIVGGGYENDATGLYATVPGGAVNTAGGAYSFAAGISALATHQSSFVWSGGESTSSWGDNTFTVRSQGGARFYTASGTLTGVKLPANESQWYSLSDRNLKDNLTAVDAQEVLGRLAEIPVTTWNYKAQDPSIRHMGPVAQDFYAAFGLGESDTSIGTLDADGVALAAIQGLYQLSQEQDARIQALEGENADLQQQLDDLQARVAALEGGAPLGDDSAGPLSSGLSAGWLLLGGLFVGGLVLVQRRRAGGRS